MTDIRVLSNLKPSSPMLASIALRFARSPKRVRKFATHLNAKWDLPGLSEEQEQVMLERAIGVALDCAAAAIEGKPVLSVVSLRDTTREALVFLRAHLDELDAAVDIPFVPDVMERWLTDELREVIDDIAIPWVDTTPRLQ